MFPRGLIVLVLAGMLYPLTGDSRDPGARRAFQKTHPCPSTGRTSGPCPGFVVDHVRPLCAGGSDTPANMQWQSLEESKRKDRLELQECRHRNQRTL